MRAGEITELVERSLRARGATWLRREVPVGEARADVAAVIDGKIVLVEVKGDGDSGARLERQLRAYGEVAHTVELWLAASVLPRGRAAWSVRFPWLDVVFAEQTAAEMARSGDAKRVIERLGCECLGGSTYGVLRNMHVTELRAYLRSIGATSRRGDGKWHLCSAIGERVTQDEAKRALARTWAVRDWEQWQRARDERTARRAGR